MRIRGGLRPDDVSVFPSLSLPGMSEIRVRENAKEVTVNTENGESRKEWEYDEYTLIVPTEDNLDAKVKINLADWLTTGREMELATNATKYVLSKQEAIDAFTLELMESGVM